jgi:hypothetical protein
VEQENPHLTREDINHIVNAPINTLDISSLDKQGFNKLKSRLDDLFGKNQE